MIKMLVNSGHTKGVLLVAPLRVCYSVWPMEITKWINFNGLTCTILHEDDKLSLWGSSKDIYIINPEGLKWLHSNLYMNLKAGKKSPFDCLIIDESTKFKSHDSKRFQYIVDMLPLFKRRHILTGTPTPKTLLDIWSQLYILDDGKTLGTSYTKFREKHFEANDWNKYDYQIKDFHEDEIYKVIAPYILNMKSEDYLDMPPVIYNYIKVRLPESAREHYNKVEQDFFTVIDGSDVSADAAAQVSMKCHQLSNGMVYEDIPEDLTDDEIKEFKKHRKTVFVHSAKIEALQDLIEELNGKPLLIAYYFKHDLTALRRLLGGSIPYIGSGVGGKRTKDIEHLWNSGKLPILLGHPDSMGHGLNLQQGGNDICWYSQTWNLESYLQFNARINRQGVKGTVRIHHLICEDTIDEAMVERLGERASQQISLREAIQHYRINRCL